MNVPVSMRSDQVRWNSNLGVDGKKGLLMEYCACFLQRLRPFMQIYVFGEYNKKRWKIVLSKETLYFGYFIDISVLCVLCTNNFAH